MKIISLQVNEKQYKKIVKISKQRDRSMSYIIREAIDKLKFERTKK